MKKTLTRMLAWLLVLVMMCPTTALAAEAEQLQNEQPVEENVVPTEPVAPEEEEVVAETATATALETLYDEEDLLPATNDELFDLYAGRALGLYPDMGFFALGLIGDELTGIDRAVYDVLKDKITAVANGTETSTEFTITLAELAAKMGVTESEVESQLTWTAAQLGVSSIFDGEAISAVATQAARNKVALTDIFHCLLQDCSYELYWFDKTPATGGFLSGCGVRATNNSTMETDDDTISINTIVAKFSVAKGYSATNATSTFETSSRPAKVATAVTTAANIVATASGSNTDILAHYKDEICSLVEYNYDAIDDGYTGGYGDPWQLIDVFDGDASTKVVCEGYAKAFKYLCDLTTFNVGTTVECYTVTGTMAGGTGAGAHMWNVVRMGNGWLLVDVTNVDGTSIGSDGSLFLAANGTPKAEYEGGKVATYLFKNKDNDEITYTYDGDSASYVENLKERTLVAGVAISGSLTTKKVERTSVELDAKTVTGETVEYARSTSATAPSTGWQTSTTFTGLTEGTTYYFFARVKATEDHNAGAAISVSAKTESKVLEGISVTTVPSKTTYVEGQNFDSAGMKVTATYTGGSTQEVTGWTVTDGNNLTAGKTSVTISYTEGGITKTTTQAITVNTKSLESIAVTTQPTKKTYNALETFNTAGMVVTAYYDNGTSAPVTGYTIRYQDGKTALQGNHNKVTVEYGGKTADVTVTVNKLQIDLSTLTWSATATFTYDGTQKQMMLSGSDSALNIVYESGCYGTNAGTYTAKVSATLKDTTNYTTVGTAPTKQWTISPKGITVTVDAASRKFGEANPTFTGTTTGLVGSDTYEGLGMNFATTATKTSDVGTYDVTGTAANTNYAVTVDGANKLTVNKADLAYTFATMQLKFGKGIADVKAKAPTSVTGVNGETVTGTIALFSDDTWTTVATDSTVSGSIGDEKTVYWTFTPNDNYNVVKGSVTVTIVELPTQDLAFDTAPATKTFGDADFTVTATTNANGGSITFSGNNGSVATVTADGKVHIVGAGSVTITATAAKVDGEYAQTTTSYVLTVNRKTITSDMFDLSNTLVYNGTEQTQGLLVPLALLKDTDYTVTGATQTDAGDYQLTIAGIGNYTGTVVKDWSIKQWAISMNPGSYQVTKVYDGTTAAGTGSGELTYDVFAGDAVTITATPVAYTDPNVNGQSYMNVTLTLSGTDSANYELPNTTLAVPCSITPKAITEGMVALDGALTYTGNTQTQWVTVTDGAKELDWGTDYSLSNNKQINANTYTLTVTGTGNYGDSVDVDYTIAKATNTWTSELTMLGWTYGGTPTTPNTNAQFGDVTYTYSTEENGTYGDMSIISAGTYWVKAAVGGTDNYTGLEAKKSFVVAKKPIASADVVLADAGLVYNGSAQTPTITSVEVGGLTVTYGTPVYANNTNAGTGKVTITGTGNFTGTVEKNFTIAPKTVTLASATATDRPYATDNKNVAIDQITFAETGIVPAPEKYTAVGVMDNDNAGSNKNVTVTVTLNDANFTLAGCTIATKVNIEKIAWNGTKTASNNTTKYGNSGTVDMKNLVAPGASLGTPSVSDANGVLDGAASLSGTTLNFKFKYDQALTGKSATVTIPVTGATNYNDYNITVTLTVADKNAANVTIPAVANKTYGNADFTVKATAGAAGTGTTEWRWESSDESVLAITSAKNTDTVTVKPAKPGTATLTVYYESATTIGSQTVTVTVAKKLLTVTAGEMRVVKTYDGTTDPGSTQGTLHVDGRVTGGQEAFFEKATVPAYDSANVGGQSKINVGVALTAESAVYYTLNSNTVTVPCEIKPLSVTYTIDNQIRKYGAANPAFTGTATGVLGSDDLQLTFTCPATATSDVGVYDITAVSGNKNYTVTFNKATLTVEKAVWGGSKSATASAKYGNSDTKDLAALMAPGSKLGTATVTDAEAILAKAPAVSGTKLSYTLADDAAKVGKTATVTIPVTNATNYEDYTITVTVTVQAKESTTVTLTQAGTTYGTALPADTKIASKTDGNGTWTYSYTGTQANGVTYSSDKAPTLPGDYTVTVTYEDKTYKGTSSPVSFSIAKKQLLYTGLEVTSKTFDDTTNATITGTLAYVGVLEGDTVAAPAVQTGTAYTGTFESKNIGVNIKVTVGNIATMTGADAWMYLQPETYVLLGTITKREDTGIVGNTGGETVKTEKLEETTPTEGQLTKYPEVKDDKGNVIKDTLTQIKEELKKQADEAAKVVGFTISSSKMVFVKMSAFNSANASIDTLPEDASVFVPYPDGIVEGGKAVVVMMKDDGTVATVDNVKVENGGIMFNPDSFGTFMIAWHTPKKGGGSSGGSSYVGGHEFTTTLQGINKVLVDGVIVNSKYYTISGTNVILSEDFLKTLSVGSHTIRIENATHMATATFTVDKRIESAKTFDAGIALYTGMALSSACGAAYVLAKKKEED